AAASKTGRSEDAEEHEDASAPEKTEQYPVGGGVADAGHIGPAQHQTANRVDEEGDGLIGGEPVQPAWHRRHRYERAGDEHEWDNHKCREGLCRLGVAGEQSEEAEEPAKGVDRHHDDGKRGDYRPGACGTSETDCEAQSDGDRERATV